MLNKNIFPDIRPISDMAINILKKRYFQENETTWEDVTSRVINYILKDERDLKAKKLIKEIILNRYFLPNSPCLVNSGKESPNLSACFVVDFPDDLKGIYKTKLDCGLITKKGGGIGTTLSKIRPEGEKVKGSSHGYAAGPINFFKSLCMDIEILSQGGFREGGILASMSVYHPDIIKFIKMKNEDGSFRIANISVLVDDIFMRKVENDEEYTTYFDYENGRQLYNTYKAREVFNLVVEGCWNNGDPGILFYNTINDSPYKYSNQEIITANLCGELPMPFNSQCSLGSIDISKFLNNDLTVNLDSLEICVRLGIKFLDLMIDKSFSPTKDIDKWAKENRPIGLGILGFADYLLFKKIAYGSEQSIKELDFIMDFISKIAKDESENLGKKLGVPKNCKKLPIRRRNITTMAIAPTGSLAIIAGASHSIEPIFSEITIRTDKTGTYNLEHPLYKESYFRCAVSANDIQEVTWKEHILIQSTVQKYVDGACSKTINFPNHTRKETIYDALLFAWKSKVKGITIYRNNSRKEQVLSPKNLRKDKCPLCGKELIKEASCKRCPDINCGFSLCEI